MMENYSHGEIIDFQAAREMLENGIAGEG